MAVDPMKLWKVTIETATYWVTATSAAEAIGLCVQAEDRGKRFNARPIPKEEAVNTKWELDSGATTTLLGASRPDPDRPHVLGWSAVDAKRSDEEPPKR